ncbi:hypothetical protein [Devosia sediminis]|uniref:Uncharacterized protein n=1 Tax=Devosia sediminis TaxID=2798801 RepID=A0A934IUW9_9HYPH|nr:hypothetical protein [Devosia sediminis]MBJ3783415.1 hypothetical protein [Devosia sediminis]
MARYEVDPATGEKTLVDRTKTREEAAAAAEAANAGRKPASKPKDDDK